MTPNPYPRPKQRRPAQPELAEALCRACRCGAHRACASTSCACRDRNHAPEPDLLNQPAPSTTR